MIDFLDSIKIQEMVKNIYETGGADYQKALIPMTSHVVVSWNLVMGQNPASAEKVAEEVYELLQRILLL